MEEWMIEEQFACGDLSTIQDRDVLCASQLMLLLLVHSINHSCSLEYVIQNILGVAKPGRMLWYLLWWSLQNEGQETQLDVVLLLQSIIASDNDDTICREDASLGSCSEPLTPNSSSLFAIIAFYQCGMLSNGNIDWYTRLERVDAIDEQCHFRSDTVSMSVRENSIILIDSFKSFRFTSAYDDWDG